MNLARTPGGLLAAAALGICGLIPIAARAQTQPLGVSERLVLASFNMCWDGEEGRDIALALRQSGFTPLINGVNYVYKRRDGDTTIVFEHRFLDDKRGRPEVFCRITALKPQQNTPFTPRGPILPAMEGLLDRIIDASRRIDSGYQQEGMRIAINGKPGWRRTQLAIRGFNKQNKIMRIEESPSHYDFIYVNAHEELTRDASYFDFIMPQDNLEYMQQLVNDDFAIRFCAAQPQNCITQEQREQRWAQEQAREATRSASRPSTFSGAPPLSSLELDNYMRRGYVIVRQQPRGF